MAKNDFKPFATAANANVMSQADWEGLPALLSGFTSGKAASAEVNKAIRQASFIAAALAQYTANKSGLDVLDDGDLNGFISKMRTAFGKDFQALDATLTALAGLTTGANTLPYFTGTDTASQTALTSVGRDIIGKSSIADVLTYLGVTTALAAKQPLDATLTALAGLTTGANTLPYFTGTDTASQTDLTSVGRDIIGKNTIADILTYLQLGEAAKRNVGTGANQIPDMSAWTSGGNSTNGWRRSPDGYIEQWGYTTSVTSVIYISFPIPFTTGLISLNEHDNSPNGNSRTMWQFGPTSNMGVNAFNMGTLITGSAAFNTPISASCRWFASGR